MSRSKISFNPCCIGIPLRIIAWSHAISVTLVFQSLLYWNTSENHSEWCSSYTSSQGFNPCCIGIPLRIRLRWLCVIDSNIAFQSLLYWNTSENSKADILASAIDCFNPCCIGIPLRIFPCKSDYCLWCCVSILVVLEYLWEFYEII